MNADPRCALTVFSVSFLSSIPLIVAVTFNQIYEAVETDKYLGVKFRVDDDVIISDKTNYHYIGKCKN